jgi:hypothetical protein
VTESASVPAADDPGWSFSPPQNYTFTSIGEKTLYAWAKDVASNVSLGVSGTTTISLPTDVPDLTRWVGKWFKIAEKSSGYHYSKPQFIRTRSTQSGYLKIKNWDPFNIALQTDWYEQDSQTGQWVSIPLTLTFFAGTSLDFMCWSQEEGKYIIGFTARIQGVEKNGELERATFKTMGGFYLDINKEDASGTPESWAGQFSLTGNLVQESKVPIPNSSSAD